ncbi:MAG: hypothetical protein J6S67_10675 [Methanobrevibacter sp.]|nr:hypothetical protein [Methanobrevibacter sp.]
MKEIFEIKKETKLYRKLFDKYDEVIVKEVFLERYINGWKTIIKVEDIKGFVYSHFASDLNNTLFTELPKEENK